MLTNTTTKQTTGQKNAARRIAARETFRAQQAARAAADAAGAEQIVNELRATAQRYHEGRMDYASYGEANARQWRAAETRGIVGHVTRLLRETDARI